MSTFALDHTRPATFDRRPRATKTPRPVPHTTRQAATAPPVRITRRGRLVIVLAALATIIVLAIAFGSSTVASGESGAPIQTEMVRVMPGHTLWQIAADANPNGDIRDTVDDIVRLNSLPNASSLQMGSEIAVPIYR